MMEREILLVKSAAICADLNGEVGRKVKIGFRTFMELKKTFGAFRESQQISCFQLLFFGVKLEGNRGLGTCLEKKMNFRKLELTRLGCFYVTAILS